MKRTSLCLVLLVCGLSFGAAAMSLPAPDISGTWTFDVKLPNGEVEHPVLVLKQEGTRLTGSYSGLIGKFTLTGTVKGDEVAINVPGKNARGEPLPLAYTGKIASPSSMSGTLDMAGKFTVDWTGNKSAAAK